MSNSATQTKLQSFVETCVNTFVGFIIVMIAGYFIYPLFGAAFTLQQNFWITCIFTVISIIRGYVIRRLFNRG
jgi:hypothetical protein